MSIHSSLKGVNTLVGERSVLSRVERIQKLTKEGRFSADDSSVFGLPKVRTKFKVITKKKAKADAAGEEGDEKKGDKE